MDQCGGGGKGMDGMKGMDGGRRLPGWRRWGVGHSQNNALKRLDNGFRMG